ncbi:MAG: 4Fe-4S binding protein [Clostridia bacterium]|nr:4Fe-4S binding protein [Clostridia bacterium]
MVDTNACIGCGSCAAICPVGAIKLVDGKAKINAKKCIKCGSCASFCPVGAIEIEKEEK